jgi:hypothetical protein
MEVAEVEEKTNACRVWDEVNESKEGRLCEYFRVLVMTTRHIMCDMKSPNVADLISCFKRPFRPAFVLHLITFYIAIYYIYKKI